LLQHRERQIEALHAMAAALFARHSVDDLVREVLRVAVEVLDAEVGSIQLYDPASDSLIFSYVIDPEAQRLIGHAHPASQGIAGSVFRSGRGSVTLRVQEHGDWNPAVDEMTGFQTRSMLTAPLKRREASPIGVVQILNGRREFDALDLEVLEVLCAYAASSIETASLLEEARRAQMVRVIGDITHDIKNMMTPVQAGIWTIQQAFDQGAIKLQNATEDNWRQTINSYLGETQVNLEAVGKVMVSACEQIQSRTGQIANAVKGENTSPVFESVELNESLSEVMRALSLVATNRGVALESEFQAHIPPVQADRRQLYNAVYNLVINAISATRPGGEVRIVSRHKPGAENVEIEVRDTGNGMTEEVRERLFTDSAVSTKPGGSGLGTRIVANVVRQHKGRIEVQSELGQGTIFSITLPLKQPPSPPF
jgi:signal transduction histidine kinase